MKKVPVALPKNSRGRLVKDKVVNGLLRNFSNESLSLSHGPLMTIEVGSAPSEGLLVALVASQGKVVWRCGTLIKIQFLQSRYNFCSYRERLSGRS